MMQITAPYFGLFGTGKTALSAVSTRTLIGDDEHGRSSHGIFNFKGGSYAKTINLSSEAEPEIFATTPKFGTIIENMVFDKQASELAGMFSKSFSQFLPYVDTGVMKVAI